MKHYNLHKRTIGVNFNAEGIATVNVWAPLAKEALLLLHGENKKLPLQKEDWGYWQTTTPLLKPGDLYQFVIDDAQPLPDPASLSQPQGVHGPSAALQIDNYKWTATNWKNLPLDQYIIYELHTGTFTEEGTFKSLEEKLPYLKSLGITAIEIMPVAQFPGSRNWGYDGVYPFAAQNSYGGAEALQHLVDACHNHGLAVILDVVYNHMGPEGNYLGAYGPYFTDKYKTPWGSALNFDDAYCDGVRAFFIQNALMWLRDFRIDALRLDAVHAIKDFSAVHLLQELKGAVGNLMQETGRQHYLIAESDLNDTRFINDISAGGYGMDAQWIDEFHHALRVTATGESTGYYQDFNGIEHLAKGYTDAYVYDGQYSPHRKKNFGVKTGNEGKQFVVFAQNHDQVGNRMLGERTSQLVSEQMQMLMAGAVLVSPYLPMLFMGEEWSAPSPFLYFVSHTDEDLAEAVRKGRKAEFAAFHAQGEAPDPMEEETFKRSKLNWDLLQQPQHDKMLQFYKTLIQLRKKHPALHILSRKSIAVFADVKNNTLVLHRWHNNDHMISVMNFSKSSQTVVLPQNEKGWYLILDNSKESEKETFSKPHTAINLQGEGFALFSNTHV